MTWAKMRAELPSSTSATGAHLPNNANSDAVMKAQVRGWQVILLVGQPLNGFCYSSLKPAMI